MEVREISKRYGKKQILKNISFQTKKGKCIGIIGANGCGKTTLLKILAGVQRADSGKLYIDGKELIPGRDDWSGRIGYVPQENALLEELSVKDNIALFAALSKKKQDEAYMDMLCTRFAINGFMKERVSKLSGGMKKRVSIVCALVNKPGILIMDEPGTALDLIFKKELKECIRCFKEDGGTVLLSSHDKGEIENCDELYVIQNGTIVPVDRTLTVEEMTEKYMHNNNREG